MFLRVVLLAFTVWVLVKVTQRLNVDQAALRVLEIVIWVVGGALGLVFVLHNRKLVVEVLAMMVLAGLLTWVIDRLHAWRVVGFWAVAATVIFFSWVMVESFRRLNFVAAVPALVILVVLGLLASEELLRR